MIKKLKIKLSEDKHLSELLKGSLNSFFFKILGMAVGYVSMLYITNRYGAKEFGILSLLITIVSIFAIIPKFGMENALVRIVGELNSLKFISQIPIVFKNVLIFSSVLALIFAFILFYLSNYIATDILNKPYLVQYIKIVAITVVTTTMTTIISATYQGMKKTKEFILIQALLLQLIFLLFLFINGYVNVSNNVVTIYVYASIVTTILSFYFIVKTLNSFMQKEENSQTKYNLKSVIFTAFPMLLSGSFAMLMSWTDIVMIGIYKNEVDVGIYSAAQRMAALASLSLIAINTIAAPKFVEFYSKGDIVGLEKIAKQSTKIIFFTSFPLILVYFIFPEYIMGLFGNEFMVGSTVLIFISIAQFVNAVSGSVGYIMQMTDNQKIFQNVIIFASIINIILNYILIPKYGINGAAIATMVSMIFWNITLMIYVKIKLGFWTIYIPSIKRIIIK